MDWKRLLKSIGIALLLLLCLGALICVMVFGSIYPWIFVAFAALVVFGILVGAIYNSETK